MATTSPLAALWLSLTSGQGSWFDNQGYWPEPQSAMSTLSTMNGQAVGGRHWMLELDRDLAAGYSRTFFGHRLPAFFPSDARLAMQGWAIDRQQIVEDLRLQFPELFPNRRSLLRIPREPKVAVRPDFARELRATGASIIRGFRELFGMAPRGMPIPRGILIPLALAIGAAYLLLSPKFDDGAT